MMDKPQSDPTERKIDTAAQKHGAARRFFCIHCGRTRRRMGGIYCCCLPNEEMIRKNKNPYRCPQCHLAYTD